MVVRLYLLFIWILAVITVSGIKKEKNDIHKIIETKAKIQDFRADVGFTVGENEIKELETDVDDELEILLKKIQENKRMKRKRFKAAKKNNWYCLGCGLRKIHEQNG